MVDRKVCPDMTGKSLTNSKRLPSELEVGATVDAGTAPGVGASRPVQDEREYRRNRDHGVKQVTGGQLRDNRSE